jgi:tetratricopeptide (TPR) repeat protein
MKKPLVLLILAVFAIAGASQSRRNAAPRPDPEIERAISRGDFPRAAGLATAQLKTQPANAKLRVLLARAELGQGNLRAALVELRRALQADPKNIDAHYYLALVADALGPQAYERLYSLAPNSERVHQLMAEAALAQENQAEAEAEFNAALAANPRSADVLLGLAELKRMQSKFEEALPLYQQTEAIIGLNHDIAYGMGVCYSYQQDRDRAIQYFQRAAALAPKADATQFALGNELFQAGKLAEAVEPLQRAVALNPKIKQAYFLLGRAYQRLGRPDAARTAFKRVEELTKADLEKEQRSGKP